MMTTRGARQWAVLIAMLATVIVAAPHVRADTVVIADTDASALVVFNEELAPYGTWVQTADFGLVWIPSQAAVGTEFKPYVTSGHWAVGEDGDWIWVSDYPFGWVVFHYGRWTWSPDHGWVWIPGREYAPAWVVWRVPDPGYAYVGWAPAPPHYYWVDGAAVSVWVTPYTPYVYCESHYLFSYHVHHHIYHDHAHLYRVHQSTHPYHAVDVHRRAPTAERVGVPPNRVPRVRTPANPRAVAFAERGVPSEGRRTAAQPRTAAEPRVATNRPAPTRSVDRASAPSSLVDRRVEQRTPARPRLDRPLTLPAGDSRSDLDVNRPSRTVEPRRSASLGAVPSATSSAPTTRTIASPRPSSNRASSSSTSSSRAVPAPAPARSSQSSTAPSRSTARPTATSRSSSSPPRASTSSRSSGGTRASTPRRPPPSRRR